MSQDSDLFDHLWDNGKIPIKINVIKQLLDSYENEIDALILFTGFNEGFRLHYTGPRVSSFAHNLVSAQTYSLETKLKLLKEVELGRMLGPFSQKSISILRISPIGLVPKNIGGWRLITHLSFPNNSNINDFIDSKICSVKYSSFDQVVDMVSALAKNALCGKIDISQAFRLLVVHPGDFDLLGIYFDDSYYIDKCMPMGCSLSCSVFEKIATFLHRTIASRTGIERLWIIIWKIFSLQVVLLQKTVKF